MRAEILGQLSRALLHQDRHEEARQPAEEMLALARRLGYQEGQAEALITLAQIGRRAALPVAAAGHRDAGLLGVGSRGEAAATAHRLHLFDPP